MRFLSGLSLAITLTPHIVHAATQLSFFEHSSCNAGTSFGVYSDPNPLTADTSCHVFSNETVAFYVNQIDQGCSIRAYLSSNCDPSASSLAGLLISLGTCFYVDEGVDLGSWRPDCTGIDYSYSNGLDKSNSWSNSTNTVPAIQSALVTATGVVTFTATTTSSSAISTSSATATAAATTTSASRSSSASGTSSAGSASATATTSSGAAVIDVTTNGVFGGLSLWALGIGVLVAFPARLY